MILKMAWRNLWRSKRRTIITLISISFGLMLSIVFTTLTDGYYQNHIDMVAKLSAGHLTVEPKDYRDSPSTDKRLKDVDGLAKKLESDPAISGTQTRIVAQAMIATASDVAGVAVFGIDPIKEKGSFYLLDYVKEGKGITKTDGRGIIIGKALAEQLEVRLGSKVVMTTTDVEGEVVSGLFKVRGLLDSGMNEMDRYVAITGIDKIRSLIGYTKNEASQIAVYLHDRRLANDIANKYMPIAAKHNGISLPWQIMLPDVAGMIAMDTYSSYFFQIIVFLLIAAGILNTILMGVLERIRELGIMLAVGLSPQKLWFMVMAETFWLSIVGLICGIIFTAPLYHYLSTTGLDMTAFMKEGTTISGIVMSTTMKSAILWDHMAIIFGGVFALIMLSGIYPAWVATKVKPIDAIKSL